jgi:Polyketide cyclase / dehydrase and lipid transport
MIKFSFSVCIEANPQKVWAALAKLEDIQLWSGAVLSAHCPGGKEHGVGAERICMLKGDIRLTEKWTAWEEGRMFAYEGYGLPMVKVATNKWHMIPDKDKTLIHSEATVTLKGGIFGRILEPIFGLMIRRMSPRAFAALKYFIENGQPYVGKLSDLPLAAATC